MVAGALAENRTVGQVGCQEQQPEKFGHRRNVFFSPDRFLNFKLLLFFLLPDRRRFYHPAAQKL
jgi:hypothetical protein